MRSWKHSDLASSFKWFSLLEMVIVIVIISILILAARKLFEMPSRYLMESERCIASVDGQVRQLFYNAVSGKSLSNSGASIQTDRYTMIIQPWSWSILRGYESSGTFIPTTMLSLSGRSIAWCQSDSHTVSLSWSRGGASSGMRIDINKNLLPGDRNGPMQLCAIDSSYHCISGRTVTTGIVSYSTCTHSLGTGCAAPKALLYELFDTRTQTIKIKKCLSLPLDSDCKNRSTDEF